MWLAHELKYANKSRSLSIEIDQNPSLVSVFSLIPLKIHEQLKSTGSCHPVCLFSQIEPNLIISYSTEEKDKRVNRSNLPPKLSTV